MKKGAICIFACVLTVIALTVGCVCAADAERAFTGTVYLRDGRTIDALDIGISGITDRDEAFFEINGQAYKIEPEKIAALDFIEGRQSKSYLCDEVIKLDLRNGNSAFATDTNMVAYALVTFLDQLTGERVTQKFDIRGLKTGDETADIIRIDFVSAGSMKYSKSSDCYFPASFSFDPYTGEKLFAASPKDID